jgi:hypothetical protein
MTETVKGGGSLRELTTSSDISAVFEKEKKYSDLNSLDPIMNWSKPCTFDLPALKAHASAIVGSQIYIYGGSGVKECSGDLLIFDTGIT